jgi:tungstate transport system ATP-binding protein
VAETLLTLRDVLVNYGNLVALQIAALDLHRREMLAIIGPNGSGKSTLLRVIGLLQRPTTGTVLFRGEHAFDGNSLQLRRRIATVFQEPLLLNATVYENAALGLTLRGVASSEISRRLEPWLERLGIAHLRRRPVRSLSGGEAQRTSLVRALVLEPEILLLDEPFAALDPTSREALLRDFQPIIKNSGMTTVFVTHDRDEAFSLSGRVGVLHQGRLLQIGAHEDVFRHPASEAAAEIVGVDNRLSGVVEDCKDELTILRVNQYELRVHGRFRKGAKVIVCLRPEDVVLSRGSGESSNSNRLSGKITAVSTGVMHKRITLDCGGIQVVALMNRKECLLGLGIAEGDEVTATFSSAAPHVIADL